MYYVISRCTIRYNCRTAVIRAIIGQQLGLAVRVLRGGADVPDVGGAVAAAGRLHASPQPVDRRGRAALVCRRVLMQVVGCSWASFYLALTPSHPASNSDLHLTALFRKSFWSQGVLQVGTTFTESDFSLKNM